MKLTLALMALFVLAGAQGAQDPLAETLRKGVVQEETNQNLDAAIQAYQSVLTQFGEERKTAATALFRLAECYRKQGKNGLAMAAYKRVVAEFADQTKLAEQSRTVLAQTFKVPTEPEMVRKAAFEDAQRSAQVEAARAVTRVSSMLDARRRYRELLLQQIAVVELQITREQKMVELGSMSAEDVQMSPLRLQILELHRQLAAFDAGIDQPAKR